MKLDIKKPNIKYNNSSGLPFEMQLLKATVLRPESLETFKPASSKVKNEKDASRNRISDFDKRRISQPKTQ